MTEETKPILSVDKDFTERGRLRHLAEEHWEYTEQIILHQLELTHRLYVEAMIHGYKHGKEDSKSNEKQRI